MKHIHTNNESQKVRGGLFNIDINLPGHRLKNANDQRGLAQFGRFDFAHLYPKVFQPQSAPWIKVDAATTEELIRKAEKCQTGAISYYKN